ncbi:DUF736 family protein [Brevundimonas sp. SORGH_AS_0993]|uniref:DUF736 domain-containing protein n=1 Tax=Brevundimonas sp. SORGH_AS_0993 TaxID=3041794 RepID=UPI00277DBC21|nr:DUF736 family protein [Brevundimonas sp. SORGH_AS_0993]MDQ1153433.1 uncharacterized protein (DUF736 family) [Brevundimonas sp. SORGH_AS_0993]
MSSLGTVVRDPQANAFTGGLALLGRRTPLPIEITPNAEKRRDNQPDYRIFSGSSELGAAWTKVGRESGREYVSLRIFHPQIGNQAIYATLGKAAGQDDDDVFAIIPNEVP